MATDKIAAVLHPCCDPSSPIPTWEGEPKGRVINIHGIETYIAQSPRTGEERDATRRSINNEEKKEKRVILHLTEGHSIYFTNAQLLADSFAANLDCDVIMPDQFSGKERVPQGYIPHFPLGKEKVLPNRSSDDSSTFIPPPYFSSPQTPEQFLAWKESIEPPVTDPIISRVVGYIHETYGEDVKIGAVGYCFGGRYVMRLMGSNVVDVGVVNHPSFFTMEEVEILGKGKRLVMFAAEKDDILPAEKRRETEDVLTKNGVSWMSTVFSGTEHGFSVRGDLESKEVRFAKEKAFIGAVEWFNEWL